MKINCLDHGYVKLLNISGAARRAYIYGCIGEDGLTGIEVGPTFDAKDIDPAICARISFNNFEEERTEEQDMKLVEYLIANEHWTPLEMTTIWLEFKLPIFIARQFHRHRMQAINEVSGRYTTLPAEWYIPEVIGGKSTTGAKQGQEDNLDANCQKEFKKHLDRMCSESYELYLTALKNNVAPEHARLFLHLNHYTTYISKMDLRNMFNFLSLRLDSHAQIEARIYATAIYNILKTYLPETMKLFDKYKRK